MRHNRKPPNSHSDIHGNSLIQKNKPHCRVKIIAFRIAISSDLARVGEVIR